MSDRGGDPDGLSLKGRFVLAIEVGSVVEGVVTGITNFGDFVELPEGKTGLIHISEVADVYVSDVHDFLKEHDKVKVKVLTVDDRGKIGLSIKALQDKSTAAQSAAAPARPPRSTGRRRRGRVRRAICAVRRHRVRSARRPLRTSCRASSRTAMNG